MAEGIFSLASFGCHCLTVFGKQWLICAPYYMKTPLAEDGQGVASRGEKIIHRPAYKSLASTARSSTRSFSACPACPFTQ